MKLKDPNFLPLDMVVDIVLHPSTPYRVIEYMAMHGSNLVRAFIAQREDLAPDLVTVLAHDFCDDVREAVATRPDLTESRILDFVEDSSAKVRRAIARREDLSEGLKLVLAADKDLRVRLAISDRDDLNLATIDMLVSCGHKPSRTAQVKK